LHTIRARESDDHAKLTEPRQPAADESDDLAGLVEPQQSAVGGTEPGGPDADADESAAGSERQPQQRGEDLAALRTDLLERRAALIAELTQCHKAKFPRAVKKITDDEAELLAFYDFPAEHWIHLRTTNPIESTFATVRLLTKVTKVAGSRAAALAMVFKLVESVQHRWRAVNAPHLVALVRTGARFERGELLERPETLAA
jgi:hypothetical protein